MAEDDDAALDPYRVIFECANDAIFLVDPGTGAIERMNRRAEELIGRDSQGVIGHSCASLFPADQAQRCLRTFHDHVAARRAVTPHLRVLRADGLEVPVEVSSAVMQLRGRDVMCCIFRDMTERYQLEERLRRSQQLEALTRMASGIAHDFNNLLTALHANLDLLSPLARRSSDAEEALRLIGEAKEVTGQAAKLARSLLELGRPPTRRERLDLNTVPGRLEGVLVGLLGGRAALDLRLWPSELPVVARRAELEQVLLNLVMNARDVTPPGGRVLIETLMVEGTPPGVALRVSDEGMGIDPANVDKIFTPFFTTKPVGTGLGLAIVDGLVRQLDGRVHVLSEPERGASFTVVLRRAELLVSPSPTP